MRFILTLSVLVFLFTATSVFAFTGWFPFEVGKTQSPPEVSILSSNSDELILEVSFPGMNISQMEEKGITYQALNIPGSGKTYNIGWPELPTFSRFIAVAVGAIPQMEILDSRFRTVFGYNVYPVQEQPIDEAGATLPAFAKDTSFYASDQLYPEAITYIEDPKIIRGCAVSLLSFFPVQYNPARSELKVYSYVKVKVSFNGVISANPTVRSSYFEPLFQNLLLNYSSLGAPLFEGKNDTASGCDFLIITHTNFKSWADSLALWKNLSGIPTRVRTTAQVGSDTTSIKSYIQNAYNTWNPRPSFVLLIGDAELVPVFYRTVHSYDGYKTGTDLYYSTLDGSDWFPDVFMGRISVDSVSQAEVVIGKILQYEKFPISDPATYYNKAMMAGFFQDDNLDGREDRFFIKTSEVVRDFMLSQGYTVERCYSKTAGSNPQYYYYGQLLPSGLTWDGNATQISGAINDGIFLLTHRDHGSVDGWGNPYYGVSHVNALTNDGKLPIVFSVNCETGHFDNETDAAGNGTPYNSVCFCEAFQRKADGGTAGIFGLTRVSWSGLNDELCKGFYDAIWPNFDPNYPNGGSTHPIYSPMYRTGVMTNFGKFWMYDKYYRTGGQGYPWGADVASTKTTFEMGMWFGDPTMQIWTTFPETLTVVYPDTIFLGSSDVSVNITSDGSPVESVLVCLANSEVYQIGLTDASGAVNFSCSTTVEGNLNITTTKHDFRPYQGSIILKQVLFIHGDANSDSLVDVSDVVFLINYLYKGEAAPYPLQAGDANCDGIVDVADVVFLINYLFKGGVEPSCP